jgi:leader peptidase (prepilin peptidase)/N-methyltransferase
MNHLFMLMNDFPYMVEITAVVFGLLFGSFANVVVYRLPIMMKARFEENIRDANGLNPKGQDVFNLAFPPSSCPHCNHLIRWYENIPVISWFWLGGKCSNCGEKISKRYPLVEALCAALVFVTAIKFGFGYEYLLVSFAALCGVAIALIDWDEQIIHPDLCNLLMWVGLLGSVFRDSIEPEQAIFGAVLGYGLLWVIQVGYLYIAKKDALGSGDLSLMGAIGAWVGPHQVGTVLSLAFFYVIAARYIKKADVVPYGPGLLMGMWVILVFGNHIPAWAKLTF